MGSVTCLAPYDCQGDESFSGKRGDFTSLDRASGIVGSWDCGIVNVASLWIEPLVSRGGRKRKVFVTANVSWDFEAVNMLAVLDPVLDDVQTPISCADYLHT